METAARRAQETCAQDEMGSIRATDAIANMVPAAPPQRVGDELDQLAGCLEAEGLPPELVERLVGDDTRPRLNRALRRFSRALGTDFRLEAAVSVLQRARGADIIEARDDLVLQIARELDGWARLQRSALAAGPCSRRVA